MSNETGPKSEALSRREMLKRTGGLLGLGTVAACAPGAVQRPEATSRSRRIAGPMVGYGTHRETAIWLQLDGPGEVWFEAWPEARPADRVRSELVEADPQRAFTAVARLMRLEPGTRYLYEAFVDGRRVELPYGCSFVTQMLWEWRTNPPEFKVAFGSCAYINEEQYDRPGQGYGGEYEIFGSVAREQADLMLWLGDNVYFREVDWASADGLAYRYTHARRTPELQPLLASTHHIATWDDHDYGPNDASWSYPFKEAALDAFATFWANPSYGFSDTPGVFTRFVWGDVEFFMLDDRYYRAHRQTPDDDTKPLLGEAQLAWLLDGLTASTATFKVIVSGSQVVNNSSDQEVWARYAKERAELYAGLEKRKVTGLLFLSGDRHMSELLRLERPSSYPLYDFTSSPLTSGPYDGRWDKENPLRVEGTLVTSRRNYGVLKFAGVKGDRRIILECRGVDGSLLWEQTLTQQQLGVVPKR